MTDGITINGPSMFYNNTSSSFQFQNIESINSYDSINNININNTLSTKYLTEKDINLLWSVYNKMIDGRSITDINQCEINMIKDTFKLLFIDKNVDQIDNMLNRLSTVKNLDYKKFITICSIYLCGIDVLCRCVRMSHPYGSYTLTPLELSLIMNKLDTDDIDLEACACSKSLLKPLRQLCKTKSSDNMSIRRDKQYIQGFQNSGDLLNTECSYFDFDDVSVRSLQVDENDKNNEFIQSVIEEIQRRSDEFEKCNTTNRIKTCKNDIKIAVFRLLIGISYRTFRPTCSIDHNSLKKVYTEPYKFTDLVDFVAICYRLFERIDVLDEKHMEYFKQLGDLLKIRYNEALNTDTNSNIDMNGYLYGKIEAEISNNIMIIQMISELKSHGIYLSNTNPHEIQESLSFTYTTEDTNYKDGSTENVIKTLTDHVSQLNREKSSLPYVPFRERYSPITVSDVYGYSTKAMIKNAFWYDEFMPLLLKIFSLDTETDDKFYELLDSKDEDSGDRLDELLNIWYDDNYDMISTYCRDVADSFMYMDATEKLIVKQCWDLTIDYIIDMNRSKSQSRDSRSEDVDSNCTFSKCNLSSDSVGEPGDLSRYIPFIDEYMCKRYVMHGNLTPAYPQYLGPPVWKFLHAIPEMIDKSHETRGYTDNDKIKTVELFKEFFEIFLKTFPCPYCRNHLNNYVVKNREILNYPIEYIFMDWGGSDKYTIFKSNIGDKIRIIKNTDDIRIFMWKFHNAVSSSTTNDILYDTDDLMSNSGFLFDDMECSLMSNTVIEEDANSEIGSDLSYTKSISSRNGSYTSGHWPNSSLFPDGYRTRYDRAVNNLIEGRERFLNTVDEIYTTTIQYTHSENDDIDALDKLKLKICEIVEKIKHDIHIMDNIILESGLLTKVYDIVD